MLIIPPSPVRRFPKIKEKTGPRPPAALNLVAASYGSFTLTLSFDRAIDITALDPSAIFVNDSDSVTRYQGGNDYSLADPNTLNLSVQSVGDYEGGGTVLEAGAESGIVAVDDGGTWGGTEGTGLPFP